MDREHRHRYRVEAIVVAGLFASVVLILLHDVLLGHNALVRTNPYLHQPWRTYATQDDLARKIGDLDSFMTYLPRQVELSRGVSAGRIPLWNPYIFGGTVFFADPQARAAYPISLVLARVDPVKAMGYDAAIHVLIAMLGMYLFLRAIGANSAGSLVGAFGYGLCSFMIEGFGHPPFLATASWIPFFFLGFEIARRREWVGTVLLTIVFALAYLAGFPQLVLLGALALAVYAAYVTVVAMVGGDLRAPLRHLRMLAVPGVISLLIVAVQLVPFREFIRNSIGLGITSDQMVRFLSHPLGLVRALIPEFFGASDGSTSWTAMMGTAGYSIVMTTDVYCGAAAFIAAIGSLAFLKRSRQVGALWCVLLLGIGLGTSSVVLRAACAVVPLLSYATISRISMITCFAVAALGGLGFSLFSTSSDRRSRIAFVGVAALLFAVTVAVYLVICLHGKALTEWFNRMASQAPLDRRLPARLTRVSTWIRDGGAGWLPYEKGVVARAIGFAGGCLALLASLFWLEGRKRLGAGLAAAFLLLMVVDLVGVAEHGYESQPRASFRTVPGVETLRQALGAPGRWRTTTAEIRREALPANTNEIFGISSLRGRCTIVPRSVADRGAAEVGMLRDARLSAAERPLSALDDFMSVRFALTDGLDARFLTPGLARAVASDKDLASHLRMFKAGGEERFAFVPSAAESLAFSMTIPESKYLDFDIGWNADSGAVDEPVRCVLACGGGGGSGGGSVEFDRVLNPQTDSGRWNSFRLDISSASGREGRLAMRFDPAGTKLGAAAHVGWSNLEFVLDDCAFEKTAAGYEVKTLAAGNLISLHLASRAREIPLEVRLGDTGRILRWILFPPWMPQRQVILRLPGDVRQGVIVTSDSSFDLLSAKLVAMPFPHLPDYDLVYDGDMDIYENQAAMENGLCIAGGEVESEAVGGNRVLKLPAPDELRRLQCGKCTTLSYEPEKVVLAASSAGECLLLFQDTYYPGWVARVDGKRAEILRTNLGIRAVELSGGEHRIVMTFEPRSLNLG
ncbi:MAG TPA: hypothetical protein VMU02_10010, partial [bacterium]|nr:hypothetical protein [bacterium]